MRCLGRLRSGVWKLAERRGLLFSNLKYRKSIGRGTRAEIIARRAAAIQWLPARSNASSPNGGDCCYLYEGRKEGSSMWYLPRLDLAGGSVRTDCRTDRGHLVHVKRLSTDMKYLLERDNRTATGYAKTWLLLSLCYSPCLRGITTEYPPAGTVRQWRCETT